MLIKILTLAALLHSSLAFMSVTDFISRNYKRCYDNTRQPSFQRLSDSVVNGQELPLPNSIEAFVSLMERYELANTGVLAGDLAIRLLKSFRIDGLDPDVESNTLVEQALQQRKALQAIFGIQGTVSYEFRKEDFTEDEQCALHLMLSHTVNDTRIDGDAAQFDQNKAKNPIENGVVSLNSEWKHAFALGRVLAGIAAALFMNPLVDAANIGQKLNIQDLDSIRGININPVYAVTVGDLVAVLLEKKDYSLLPNGMWNDAACTTQYRLDDNLNKVFFTYSEFRGAVDGLLIGRELQRVPELKTFRLSQILRMYYGNYGLLADKGTWWCTREREFERIQGLDQELLGYAKLYKALQEGIPASNVEQEIRNVIDQIKGNIFKDVEKTQCDVSDNSIERKYTSPRNIFVITDSSSRSDVQTEIIGNLSNTLNIRPLGDLMGVYTNKKPLSSNLLDTVINNTGTAGCPACYSRYYRRSAGKEEEFEVFRDLNYTLTLFDHNYQEMNDIYQLSRAGSPGQVVLYFNYGSPPMEYRLRQALDTLQWFFPGVTLLAVGDKRDSLKQFVKNEDTDIFSENKPAESMAKSIKERLAKIPGEFTYPGCEQSSPSKESANKQEAYIQQGKVQYWAMYPQYFIKSFDYKLTFRALEGGSIKVCYTRSYYKLLQEEFYNCKEAAGIDVDFYDKNPCKKKNLLSCEPFYFYIEGKKQPNSLCQDLRCSTPRDITFEFQHEGLSCNKASMFSLSVLAAIFSVVVMLYTRKE